MAEILSELGYFTAAAVANYAVINQDMGLDQGFQYFRSLRPTPFAFGSLSDHCLRGELKRALRPLKRTLNFERLFMTAEEITELALSIVERAHESTTPFFLFVNFMDTHDSYLPPKPYASRLGERVANLTHDRYDRLCESLLAGDSLSPREREHIVSQYDGGIAYMDSQFALFVRQLKTLKVYDNTLLVVIGDHGEGLGEHGMLRHGRSVFQDVIHIPLIVKYPNQSEGRVLDVNVSQVDVLPTILSVVGVTAAKALPGSDLRSIASDSTRLVIATEFPVAAVNMLNPKFGVFNRAIVRDKWKLISYFDGSRVLYDVSEDPHEVRDLSASHGDQVRVLSSELEAWEANTPRYSDSRPGNLSQGSLKRLRELSYIQ